MEATPAGPAAPCLALTKMETLVREMQSPESGVPVRGQKMFLTTIPSAFMGYDLIEWLMTNLPIEDAVEALHLATLLCQYGYFFPVGDAKTLHVKDDSSLYRFQTPYYWPSQNHVPDSTDYAIYIHKKMVKTKQKHVLEEYELEAYNQLKKTLASKWDFVVMQAEEQLKMAKDRKKGDKIVSESQERAYWRVYRPPPGFTNTLECRPVPDRGKPGRGGRRNTATSLAAELQYLQGCLQRSRFKVSQAAECLITSYETYLEFDPLLSPVLPSNPWLSDDPTFLELNEPLVDCPTEWRVRRWAISMDEMISDPTGLQEITKCMKKEHSHENIRFWTAVHQLKKAPLGDVKDRVNDIYTEFLRPGAPCEINIDGKTMEKTQARMTNPNRYSFDPAADHIYELLLKKDCYPRFLRSEHYKSLLSNAVNPTSKKRFFTFGAAGKKKVASTPTNQGQGVGGGGRLSADEALTPGQRQDGADDLRDSHAGIFLGGPSRSCAGGSLPRLTLPSSPCSPAAGPASAGPASAPAASAIPSPAFSASLPPPATPSAGGTASRPPPTSQPGPALPPVGKPRPDQVCERDAPPARSALSPLSPLSPRGVTASPALRSTAASPSCVAPVEVTVALRQAGPHVKQSESELRPERGTVTPVVVLECNPGKLKTAAEDPVMVSTPALPSSDRSHQDAAAVASLAPIAETPEPSEAASSHDLRRQHRVAVATVSLEERPRRQEKGRQRHGSVDWRGELKEGLERQGRRPGDGGKPRKSSGAHGQRGQTMSEEELQPESKGKPAPAEAKSPEKKEEDVVCPWEHE